MTSYDWNGLTDDWTVAADWTPAGVPGAGDTASVTADGTYTLGIDASETIDVAVLTLNAADATLQVDGQLSAGDLELDAGTLLLNGALADTTLHLNGGVIAPDFGVFSNVTVEGALDLGNSGVLLVQNGLTVTAADGVSPGEIDVTGAGAATLVFTDAETIDNVTINVGSDIGFDGINANGSVLVLGAGVVLNSVGLNGVQLGGNAVTNEGAINAGVAGSQAFITSTDFDNAGALNVTGGQTLTISSTTFENTGSLYIDSSSELDFAGTIIAASQASGGTVDIEGTLNANGSTIDLGATSAFANATLGGTLENAVIVSDGGAMTYNFGTLVAATVYGTLDLGGSGDLFIQGGLTVLNADGTGPGEIDVTGSGAATLVFADSETLDNVTLNVGSDTGFDMTVSNGASLVLGAGAVVNSIGLNGLQLVGGGSVTNEGTINAGVATGAAFIQTDDFDNAGAINVTGGQTLAIASTTFENTGSLYIDSSSEVDFGGTVIAASQASGGTVDIEGTLNANGSIIDLGATSAFANATLGGTLENALIVSDGGAMTYNFGTLVAATVNGTLDLGNSGVLLVQNGLTVTAADGVSPGEIDVTGAGAATLVFTDAETIDNVTINVGSDIGFDGINANGSILVLGAGVVLNSVGLNGVQLGGNAVTNEGAINAGVAGSQAFITSTDFDNAGALNVTGGQTLTISSTTFENTGSLYIDSSSELDFGGTVIAASQASGGTVDIEGTLNANGSIIDLGATSAFANATLGGTLENALIVSDGGAMTYNFGTLVAATVNGTLDLGNSGVLLVQNGLTVTAADGVSPGEIDVTGVGAATLVFTDAETIDNVTINVGSDIGFDGINANGSILVLGAGVVLNSVGLNGLQLGGNAVTNEGAINAGVAGSQAFITSTDFDNAGALNVTGGQTLTISSTTFENTGSLYIDSSSELDFAGTIIAVSQASGGTVDIEGTLNANGSTIDLGATSAFANTTLGGTLENAVIVSDGGTITYNIGTLVAATVYGTLDLGGSGDLIIQGGLTVLNAAGTGPGVINVTGSGAAALVFDDSETIDNVTLNVGSNTGFDMTVSNGASLVLGAGAVVNSTGLNGLQFFGGGTLTNEGTINANVATGVAEIETGGFTNAGKLMISNLQLMTISSATGTVTNTGLISVASGSLDIASSLTGTGQIIEGKPGTIEFGGAVSSGQTISMIGSLDDLVLDDAAGFAARVKGFVSSDRIVLTGVATIGSTVKASGSTAVVKTASGTVTLNLGTLTPGWGYGLDAEGNGNTNLFDAKIYNGAAGGHSTINTPIGNAIVNAYGVGNTITINGRDSVVNAGAGGAKVTINNGFSTVNLAGSGNTVKMTGNGALDVLGSTSSSTITLGDKNDTVALRGNSNTVNAGGGNNTVSITGNLNTVTVTFGVQAISVSGASNTVKLLASASGTITVGGTNDVVFLGTGTPTIADTGKGLHVVAGKGIGQDILTGIGKDPSFVLDIVGGAGGYTSAAKAYAALKSDGLGGSILSLGGQSSVDFAGVAPNHLSAKNFAVMPTYHA